MTRVYNICVPAGGICFPERAEENHITRMTEDEALFRLLDQTARPDDEGRMELLLSLIEQTLKAVPVRKMGCSISSGAARMSYTAMSAECTDRK